MRSARGFSLIELMIVVLVIAVIAAIALPNLLSARLSANETTAIATLRAIAGAQSHEAYSGPGSKGPAPGASRRTPGDATLITGLLATGGTGRDGALWRAVQK